MDMLEELNNADYSTLSSPISEDELYTLIQHNSNTLVVLNIGHIILRSRTKLASLLHNVPRLASFKMDNIVMPKHQLYKLRALMDQRSDIFWDIENCNNVYIMPDTQGTD